MDRLQFRLQEHKLDVTISAPVKLQSELIVAQPGARLLDLIQAQDRILTTHSV